MHNIILKSDVYQLKLEPLAQHHFDDLRQACIEGDLSTVIYNSVPYPEQLKCYFETAFSQMEMGERIAFAVVDLKTGRAIGTTSFHDIRADIPRYEIGYTWYAKSFQRSYVNRISKYLLLTYAFEQLNAHVVGFRTDHLNLPSQNAIQALGARLDGIIRGHMLRKDGQSIRDTHIYSILSDEWPELKNRLEKKILKYSDQQEFKI